MNLKTAALSTKAFVQRHRVAIAVTATTVVWYALHRRAVEEWYDFLKEKGIDPMEFYCPEYYEELHS